MGGTVAPGAGEETLGQAVLEGVDGAVGELGLAVDDVLAVDELRGGRALHNVPGSGAGHDGGREDGKRGELHDEQRLFAFCLRQEVIEEIRLWTCCLKSWNEQKAGSAASLLYAFPRPLRMRCKK